MKRNTSHFCAVVLLEKEAAKLITISSSLTGFCSSEKRFSGICGYITSVPRQWQGVGMKGRAVCGELEQFSCHFICLVIGNREIILLNHVDSLVWNKPRLNSNIFPKLFSVGLLTSWFPPQNEEPSTFQAGARALLQGM